MTQIDGCGSFDPFGMLLQLQGVRGRAFARPTQRARAVFPALQVFRDADGYMFRVPIPGLGAENIDVETQGNSLRISGKRPATSPAKGAFRLGERWSGEFSRTVQLPKGLDPSQIEARYRSGVLTLRIPFCSRARPRRIDVS